MVNTFLVTSNFRTSATYLCRMHLGKQRVEAMQIRNALLDLEYLSWYFEVEMPPRGAKQEVIYAWVDQVMGYYKELPYRFVWDSQFPEKPVPVRRSFKYQRAKDTEVFTVEGEVVIVSTKTGLRPREIPLEEFLFPWQRLLGDGLRKHPVLVLWHTYTEALGDYINAHIEEWIARGYNNTMKTYPVSSEVEYPPWCEDPEFHRRMRARLREKEYTWWEEYDAGQRKQQPEVWYTQMDLFLEAGEDNGYLW